MLFSSGLSLPTIVSGGGGGAGPAPYQGPLDVVPGATVAYGQRAMSAAMIGGAVYEIAVGEVEQAFFSLPNGHVDNDAILAFIGGGTGLIASWFDQSGNGVDLDDNSFVRWANDVPGGIPGIRCVAAANGGLYSTNEATMSTGQFTIIAVAIRPGRPQITADNGDGSYALIVFTQDNLSLDVYNDTIDNESFLSCDPSGVLNQVMIYEMHADQTTQEIFINGVAQSPPLVTGDASVPLASITGNIYVPLNISAVEGVIQELIFYPSLLTSEQRTALRLNIAAYYGIAI